MVDEIDPTTRYAQRSGDYVYDIICYSTTMAAQETRFCALIVNLVRLQNGQWVRANAMFQAQYGETRADAIDAMRKVVDEWAEQQPWPD
jgi:hypothetical protein